MPCQPGNRKRRAEADGRKRAARWNECCATSQSSSIRRAAHRAQGAGAAVAQKFGPWRHPARIRLHAGRSNRSAQLRQATPPRRNQAARCSVLRCRQPNGRPRGHIGATAAALKPDQPHRWCEVASHGDGACRDDSSMSWRRKPWRPRRHCDRNSQKCRARARAGRSGWRSIGSWRAKRTAMTETAATRCRIVRARRLQVYPSLARSGQSAGRERPAR